MLCVLCDLCGYRSGRLDSFSIRIWVLTILLLAFHYGHLPWFCWPPEAPDLWTVYQPQLIGFYDQFAKAAMLVALLAHFWWLAGMIKAVRGGYATTLSQTQRRLIIGECQQTALRLSVVVGLAAGLWMFAHGLAYGFTYWSWLFSAGLAVLFTVQVVILNSRPLRTWKSFRNWLMTLSSAMQFRLAYRPLELAVIVGSIACPAVCNLLAQVAGGIWKG